MIPYGFDEMIDRAARGVVLANSVKDEVVMERLIAAAERGVATLAVVLTGSLKAAFVTERLLPNLAVAIASYDEFFQISGWEIPKTVAGALDAAAWMRRFAPSADLFLTMGPEGVLVAPSNGSAVVVAVRRPSPWTDIQDAVAGRATLAGVGDCFAAGLVHALSQGVDPVSATVRGSMLAIRWAGYTCPINPTDFVCDDLGAGGVARPRNAS